MAEWSKANDSKSFEGQPSVGSNPTLSVQNILVDSCIGVPIDWYVMSGLKQIECSENVLAKILILVDCKDGNV